MSKNGKPAIFREPALLDSPLLDALSDHAAVVAPNGEIIFINAAWKRFASQNGYDDSRFGLHRNYLEICANDADPSAQQVRSCLESVLSGDPQVHQIYYPCHAPHLERWFGVKIGPITFKGAEPHALVLHHDATELYTALRTTRQSQQDLEHLIVAAAHELQQPLRNIRALSLEPESGSARIQQEVTRAQSLLSALIEYTEEGTRLWSDVEIDFDSLLAECISVVELPEDCNLAQPQSGIRLRGDRLALRHIMVNLIDNAIRHNPAPRPHVWISITRSLGGATVTVEDNGPGIDPTLRSRLLRPLSRLAIDDDTDRPGMGLSICQRGIERHGGELTLGDSALGGCRAQFSWPDNRRRTTDTLPDD